eukprot:s2429_g5.t1
MTECCRWWPHECGNKPSLALGKVQLEAALLKKASYMGQQFTKSRDELMTSGRDNGHSDQSRSPVQGPCIGGRHSPSASHGKYRIGQLSKLGQNMFRLPEIPGTPGEKEKVKDAKSAQKKKNKLRPMDGPQEVSLEAAKAFWDLAASQEVRGRHRASQDEDRQPSTNSHYPAFVQHSGPGIPELSHRVGLPQQVAKEAAHLFQRFAEIPKGGNIFDGKLQISQLTEVLVALCVAKVPTRITGLWQQLSALPRLKKQFYNYAPRRRTATFCGTPHFAE